MGNPTTHRLKEDAEDMFKFLREKVGLKGKIGVYGRSLGGIATCHLANFSNTHAVIADRTFGELSYVAMRKFMVLPCLSNFLKCLMAPERSLNDINFERAPCHKLICIDNLDNIIDYEGSLLCLVAFRVIQTRIHSL